MSSLQLIPLGSDIWTSPQLQAEDFGQIAAQGFRTVINNRPDHEAPDQPLTDDLRAAAEQAGLRYEFLPVVGGQITQQQVEAFAQHLRELPKPILTFCRTGNRCSMLFSYVQQLKLL